MSVSSGDPPSSTAVSVDRLAAACMTHERADQGYNEGLNAG